MASTSEPLLRHRISGWSLRQQEVVLRTRAGSLEEKRAYPWGSAEKVFFEVISPEAAEPMVTLRAREKCDQGEKPAEEEDGRLTL